MILDLGDIESGWREGNYFQDDQYKLPIVGAATVQDESSFLVVGGELSGTQFSDKVYLYDIFGTWRLLAVAFPIEAADIQAFNLPDDYVLCNN